MSSKPNLASLRNRVAVKPENPEDHTSHDNKISTTAKEKAPPNALMSIGPGEINWPIMIGFLALT